MPALLVCYTISWLGIAVNPCRTILVFIVSGLLCVGIKEECLIYMSGGYLSFKTGGKRMQPPKKCGVYAWSQLLTLQSISVVGLKPNLI